MKDEHPLAASFLSSDSEQNQSLFEVVYCNRSLPCFLLMISAVNFLGTPPGMLSVVTGGGGSWKANKRQGDFKTFFISFSI